MIRPRTLLLAGMALQLGAQDAPGLYQQHCAVCHEASDKTRAPAPTALRQMSPELIVQSLERGTMREIGARLSPPQKRLLATHLAAKPFGAVDTGGRTGYCRDSAAWRNPEAAPQWNGWGVDLYNTRFQPVAGAGLRAGQVPKLKLRWAFGFAGAVISHAQPSVFGGRVFLGSALRKVYSLDAATGCIHFEFETSSPVRSALTVGQLPGTSRRAAWFGDQSAYVYAIDAANGALIWKVQVEDFPNSRITGAPKLHGNRLYVPVSIVEDIATLNPKYECCKSRPSVVALDAGTGRVIWKTRTIEEEPKPTVINKAGTQMWGPSGAAVWSSPTIDEKRKALYIGTGDNHSHPVTRTSDAILAMDLDTGKLLWVKQITENDAFNIACGRPGSPNCPDPRGPDFDFGSPVILVTLASGRRLLLAGQKSGVMHALDPDRQGEIVWQTRVGKGSPLGGIQWGSAADGDNVYAPVSDIAFTRSPAGGRMADPAAGGGLWALQIATGEKVWHAPPTSCGDRRPCSPAQSAPVSVIQGVVFSGSVDGHLRGYSTKDGRVIWDFDTAREFETVNGVKAKGGSMDAAGPVIAGGMLFMTSGYGLWGGMPGNVLLAFAAE